MKSLSGWEAASSDEHQFHAKIKVIVSSFDKWSEEERKKEKNGIFTTAHFCV